MRSPACDALHIGPEIEVPAGELGSLIDPDRLRIARGYADAFKGRNHVFGPIAEPWIDDGREPAEYVHHGEHTDLLASSQLVMDEVHGPNLIGCGSCATIVAQLRLHSSLWRLVAQLQAQTRVNPMRLLHVDLPALAAQKNMDAPVAIPNARVADLFDADFKAGLLAAARFVVIGGPIEFQNGARPPDRDAPIIANRRRQLALASRPYSFRRITS